MLKMTGKKKAGLQRMPVLFICVCVLPTLILTLLFTVIPTLRALWMSLFDSTALGMNSTFIGIENYLYMFQDDKFLGQHFQIVGCCARHHNRFCAYIGFYAFADKIAGTGTLPYRVLLS